MKLTTALIAIPMFAIAASDACIADDQEVKDAIALLKTLAQESRERAATKTFEEYKATLFREPGPDGKFIVNGDVGILNEKLLLEFYNEHVKKAAPTSTGESPEFIVNTVGGLDDTWSDIDKRQLTYCVATAFGPDYSAVIAAMESATGAWEAVADINFVHIDGEDGRCDQTNSGVVFDVRPVDFGEYLARAFFPGEPRVNRNVLIDSSSFNLDPNQPLTLTGILRHELGHAVGGRHEQTRPEAGTCFEDNEWRPLTNYDAFSVMHYPQCNGLGDWSLTLTAMDMSGVACLYGAASGFSIDPTVCQPRLAVQTASLNTRSVAKGEQFAAGEYEVRPGSRFVATMTGDTTSPGDPDLYVKFDAHATEAEYDCRPYLIGAEEACTLDVPTGAQLATVMVRGYEQGRFNLSIQSVSP